MSAAPEPIAAIVALGAGLPKWVIPAATVGVVIVALYLVYRSKKPQDAVEQEPEPEK